MNIKKLTALALAGLTALSLAACTPQIEQVSPSPEPELPDVVVTPVPENPSGEVDGDRFALTLEEYPRVDGSTANLPLMAAVMAEVTGITVEEAETMTSCTTTPYAYEALINDSADILLVYEPAAETYKVIEDSGVELEFIPIGRDALVFIANESNPVTGLTTQQLLDIYTGKITNWKDVGGSDNEIKAYQRASASGSQALFMKLLMQDVAPMTAPTEFYPTEMGDLIEVLATYNNDGGALGFSVFYYASYMYSKPGLKFLAVDGVAPANETIADGSYPFLNSFYAVIRKDAEEGSPERLMANWLTSPDGKECITSAGYIALR